MLRTLRSVMGQTLSETRKTVLTRTIEGQTARQIARDLDLSSAVVYRHLRRLRALGYLPPKEGAA